MALRLVSHAPLRPGRGLHLAAGWLQAAARRWILALVLVQALAVRLYLVGAGRVAPPGDSFNYLFIARAFLEGRYPVGEKRLPLYPLFVALGWAGGLDPVDWGIGLSVLASVGTVLMTYFLARSLGLSRLSGYLGAAIVSFDRFLLAESIRPLSESLFTFLVVSAFVAFFRARSLRGWALFGLVAGLAALTRWEGFIAAGALFAFGLAAGLPRQPGARESGLGTTLGSRPSRLAPEEPGSDARPSGREAPQHQDAPAPQARPNRGLPAAAAAFALTVSPIFIANAAAYGSPLHLQYLRDARAPGESYIVSSAAEFRENLGQVLWDQLGTQPGLAQGRARKVVEILQTRNWGEGKKMLRDTKHSLQLGAAAARLVLVLGGLLVFGRAVRWRALPVVGFVLLEFLLVAWWTPLSRFLSVTAPFVALWMGAGLGALAALFAGPPQRLRLAGPGASGALALALVALLAAHSLQVLRGEARQRLYQDYALFQAVRYAAYQLEGAVVFATEDSMEETMARPYLEGHEPNRLILARGQLAGMPPQEQVQWLREAGARYVVRFERHPAAVPVLNVPDFAQHFRLVKRFEYARPGYQDRGPALFWAEIYEVR